MKYLQTDKIPQDVRSPLKQLARTILRYQARLILKKYKPKIIAITGSVGKTLTKEALYLPLSKNFFVRKSGKSLTADFGVPLTVIGSPAGIHTIMDWLQNFLHGLRVILFKISYPEWLILEVDNDKPGDLRSVSSLFTPDIIVLTAIGEIPAHIEAFGTLEDYERELSNFLRVVRIDGLIAYNADDPVSVQVLHDIEARKIGCGIESGNILGTPYDISYETGLTHAFPIGMSFRISYNEEIFSVPVPESIGIHNEYSRLLAFAVASQLKLEPKRIISNLCKVPALPSRMRILTGILNTVIIDDSYNSSPQALLQALNALKKIKTTKRKVAIIGDMMELGRFSAVEHRKAAHELRHSADIVITVGLRAKKIAEELFAQGFNKKNILSFDTAHECGEALHGVLKNADIVLVKGSQAMRLEKVVEKIMLTPQDKKKLLARQDREWLNR